MTVGNKSAPCYLVLEDGTTYPGEFFGAREEVDGEVGKLIVYGNQHVV